MSFKNLRTIKQISDESPAFTEKGLRWLIFNKERNGFARCVRKVGGRVLIDVTELDQWIEKGRPEVAEG